MQELERTAAAMACQTDTLKSGQVLAQAEIEFLQSRLRMHTAAAATLTAHGKPESGPLEVAQVTEAVKGVKDVQGKLVAAIQVCMTCMGSDWPTTWGQSSAPRCTHKCKA